MEFVHGWYSIVNRRGEERGQLLAGVYPLPLDKPLQDSCKAKTSNLPCHLTTTACNNSVVSCTLPSSVQMSKA